MPPTTTASLHVWRASAQPTRTAVGGILPARRAGSSWGRGPESPYEIETGRRGGGLASAPLWSIERVDVVAGGLGEDGVAEDLRRFFVVVIVKVEVAELDIGRDEARVRLDGLSVLGVSFLPLLLGLQREAEAEVDLVQLGIDLDGLLEVALRL